MIEVPSAALTADLLAARGRLLHHRHQRSDPVLPRRRSRRRARVAAVRAAAPGDPADDPAWSRGRAARRGIPVSRVRRDGRRPGAAGAARRPGPERVQHGAGRDSRWRSRCSAACARRTRGSGCRRALRARTAAEVEKLLVDFVAAGAHARQNVEQIVVQVTRSISSRRITWRNR